MPGYALIPGENSVPYAQPDAEVRRRARFVDHHLWVTRYRPNELYSAGDFPSLNPRIEGLPNFIQDDESLVSQDVVLWYTLGVTHIPRPEDWPIMPTHRTGFKLIPVSFFDRNPTVGSAPRPASRR
jgi:primary-amine oxidase